MTGQLLVIAKAPLPGQVKTRLCPPCTPTQAARLAAASLADTLGAVRAAPAAGRVLVLSGVLAATPPGFAVIGQRGPDLAHRLAAAFADAPQVPSLLIGMDTPQVTPELLHAGLAALGGADAVLGLAADGGWWGLGLRDPHHASVLAQVETSTDRTGARTLAALRGCGLTVAALPVLRDVDTIADAHEVAALIPCSRFAAELARVVPAGVPASFVPVGAAR